jgi:hypothetical protein
MFYYSITRKLLKVITLLVTIPSSREHSPDPFRHLTGPIAPAVA